MAKKADKANKAVQDPKPASPAPKEAKAKPAASKPVPWIQMRTGIYVVTAASILMAVLTAWQSIPFVGWLDGILYGLLFGAMVWIVFYFSQLFFRWLRQ